VADQGLSTAFGNALIAIFDWAWPRVAPRLNDVAEHLADLVIPEPPMTIRTLDGEILTGILVVNRGQAIAFLGTRHPAPTYAPSPPRRPPFEQRYPFESDEELWARGVDPYQRR
jgi:hypothetical protein